MNQILDMHDNENQPRAEVYDHIEIEDYKNQKNTQSRLSSYILNALYNSNTSFWSIAGIESLCQSFELSIVTWPLYFVAGIFTLGNLGYDLFVSSEQDKKHENKVEELSTIIEDEKLKKWTQKLKNLDYDIDLISYAKTNTTDTILDDVLDDYFRMLDYIDTQLTHEDLNEIQITQLKNLRNQMQLQLQNLRTALIDKEFSYRVNVSINENINAATDEHDLPLIAQAYFWLAKNFKTFTTGAVTATGATICIFSLLGITLFSGFFLFGLFTMLSIGIVGGVSNYLLNQHYFDAAESEFEQRKTIKNTLLDKSAILKCKVNLHTLEYQSKIITQHEIAEEDLPEIEGLHYDYIPQEILKIEKPSQLRRYLIPILVGAFALYEGYSIAYNLIAPILFVGLQSLASIIPFFGIALAVLHASKKIIEYLDANKEVDSRYEQLNKMISHEKVQLWQHKLHRAGLNTNVADLIYNSSRNELIALLDEEYQNLMHMMEVSGLETSGVRENLHVKMNRNISKIKSTKFKTKVLEILDRADEIDLGQETRKEKVLRFCREAVDFFEANWADAFEGATTICALSAAALFLLMSTPAITIIIPVLIFSFVLGGIGTIIFQTFFENSTQYSMMNIKNTEKKLEDKITIYKMLQSTLIAQTTLQVDAETTPTLVIKEDINSYQAINSSLTAHAIPEPVKTTATPIPVIYMPKLPTHTFSIFSAKPIDSTFNLNEEIKASACAA